MRQYLKQLRESTFIRHNAIFFLGSMGIGLLNYLFYPAIGRLLPPDSFGEVQTLISLFAQITIFLSVLGLITVNIVANYDDAAKRNQIILELERLAGLIGLGLFIVAVLGSPWLKQFFRFDSVLPFPVLALALLVSIPLTFRTAYLRGIKRFGWASVMGIIASATDLVLAIIFVLAGLGTVGAILGLVAGQAAAFAYAAAQARRHGFSESWRASLLRLPDFKLVRPELKYALLVLITSLGITAMYSLDSLVVKHYFDAHTAGLYAGISTVARIIFFLTGSITVVLLSSVKMNHTPQENQRVLVKSLGLLLLLGGLALICFTLLPRLIIHILMGATYLPYAYLLPRLSLVLFIISLLNLFLLYNIALRRYAMALIVILGIAVTYGLLSVHHQTLVAVIDSLLYGSLVMLGLLAIWAGIRELKARRLREGSRAAKVSLDHHSGL